MTTYNRQTDRQTDRGGEVWTWRGLYLGLYHGLELYRGLYCRL